MKPLVTAALATILLSACGNEEPHERRYEKTKRESAERIAAGAIIQSNKQISAGENIRVLVIPGTRGIDSFRCVLYSNSNTGTANLSCPGNDLYLGHD